MESLPMGGEGGIDFILLDRSRGPWGEPADDITALTINYIFFSVKHHGDVREAYLEGLNLFFDEYIKASGDTEITEVVAPFFAFRGVVVANPVFFLNLPLNREDFYSGLLTMSLTMIGLSLKG